MVKSKIKKIWIKIKGGLTAWTVITSFFGKYGDRMLVGVAGVAVVGSVAMAGVNYAKTNNVEGIARSNTQVIQDKADIEDLRAQEELLLALRGEAEALEIFVSNLEAGSQAQSVALAEAEDRLAALLRRIGEAEVSLTDAKTNIDSANSNIETANNNIEAASEEIEEAAAEIAITNESLAGAVATLNASIATETASVLSVLEAADVVINASITTVSSDVATIASDLGFVQGDVTTLQTGLSTASMDIQVLTTDLSAVQTSVVAVESDITTIETNLNSVMSEVSNNTQSFTSLNTTVTSLNSQVGGFANEIGLATDATYGLGTYFNGLEFGATPTRGNWYDGSPVKRLTVPIPAGFDAGTTTVSNLFVDTYISIDAVVKDSVTGQSFDISSDIIGTEFTVQVNNALDWSTHSGNIILEYID